MVEVPYQISNDIARFMEQFAGCGSLPRRAAPHTSLFHKVGAGQLTYITRLLQFCHDRSKLLRIGEGGQGMWTKLDRPVDSSIEIDKWFPHWYRKMNRDWITDHDEQAQWPVNSRNDMHDGPPHIGEPAG